MQVLSAVIQTVLQFRIQLEEVAGVEFEQCNIVDHEVLRHYLLYYIDGNRRLRFRFCIDSNTLYDLIL